MLGGLLGLTDRGVPGVLDAARGLAQPLVGPGVEVEGVQQVEIAGPLGDEQLLDPDAQRGAGPSNTDGAVSTA